MHNLEKDVDDLVVDLVLFRTFLVQDVVVHRVSRFLRLILFIAVHADDVDFWREVVFSVVNCRTVERENCFLVWTQGQLVWMCLVIQVVYSFVCSRWVQSDMF